MKNVTSLALPFVVSPVDLEAIGRNGGGGVNVTAHGYYSRDLLTLYVVLENFWQTAPNRLPAASWDCTINTSSGGRDKEELADDLEAAGYFAQAMLALVHVGRVIRTQSSTLEASYQEERIRSRALYEAVAAAAALDLAKRIANDTELGSAAACALVASARDLATRRTGQNIHAYRMGDEKVYDIFRARAGRDGVVRFSHSGVSISAANLAARLATYSHSTYVAAAV